MTDEDMRHAVRFPILTLPQGADRVLYIGMDRVGHLLLEVVVMRPIDDHERIIHAMKLRPKLYLYLTKGEKRER